MNPNILAAGRVAVRLTESDRYILASIQKPMTTAPLPPPAVADIVRVALRDLAARVAPDAVAVA